jgi:hypothetical protein
MGMSVASGTRNACPAYLAFASARCSFRDQAASRPMLSVMYRQAAVPPQPGRQLGGRLAFVQVGQDQQRVLLGFEIAPVRADLPPVTADNPGCVGEGRARQRRHGR